MTRMAPIYTTHNCRFSHPLSWTLSLFWRDPMENADWFSPRNAALASDGIRLNKRFLNNLAFAQEMEAVFQFGGFIGTVGEYDFGALRNQTSPDPDKQDRGGTP